LSHGELHDVIVLVVFLRDIGDHLYSTDTSSIESYCVWNVSDTRVGHPCRVYF